MAAELDKLGQQVQQLGERLKQLGDIGADIVVEDGINLRNRARTLDDKNLIRKSLDAAPQTTVENSPVTIFESPSRQDTPDSGQQRKWNSRRRGSPADTNVLINNEALRKIRVSAGLTQGVLRKQSSLSQGFISKLESGKARGMSRQTAEKLAQALGVDVSAITTTSQTTSENDAEEVIPRFRPR